jgi:transporter family protein
MRGTNISGQFTHGALPFIYLMIASAFLSVGVWSLYKALCLGPASVVQPIIALNFVVVSVLGLMLLGEPFKAERMLGLVLAGVAIWLLAK